MFRLLFITQEDFSTALSGFLVMWTVYWFFGLMNLFVHMRRSPKAVFARKLQPKALFDSNGCGSNPPLISFLAYLVVSHVVFVFPSMLLLQSTCRIFFDTGVQTSWPGWSSMAWQVVLHGVASVLFVEVAFYYVHRFLHWGPMYGWCHKVRFERKENHFFSNDVKKLFNRCIIGSKLQSLFQACMHILLN